MGEEVWEQRAELGLPHKQIRDISATVVGANQMAASFLLAGIVSHSLSGARLVYWQVGRLSSLAIGEFGERLRPPEFAAGIYCPDYKTAIAVRMVLFNVVRICPWCKSVFELKRSDQICCDEKDAGTYRLARWRERKKAEATSKASPRGK